MSPDSLAPLVLANKRGPAPMVRVEGAGCA